jgi:hypothetical protein
MSSVVGFLGVSWIKCHQDADNLKPDSNNRERYNRLSSILLLYILINDICS